jgi:hypothetical protein
VKDGKFEVGDKVRVSGAFGLGGIDTGDEGVVTEASGKRWRALTTVRFDNAERPTNGHDDGWYVLTNDLELVAPSASPAPSVERIVGAKVDDVRFSRDGDRVEVIVYDENGDGIGSTITIDQLREVVKILEGGNV